MRGRKRHRYAIIDDDDDDKAESMEMLPKGTLHESHVAT